MVESLDSTVRVDMEKKLKESKFVGIITDESVDIAVFKKPIIYAQLVVNGKVQLFFIGNKDVCDGKADTIIQALVLQEWQIPLTKVTGLGSDAAAVMRGVRNGVGQFPLHIYNNSSNRRTNIETTCHLFTCHTQNTNVTKKNVFANKN